MPSERLLTHGQWAALLTVCSLLLVGGGIGLVVAGSDGPSQRYHRVDVGLGGEPFEIAPPGDVQVPQEIQGIDCVTPLGTRRCLLERSLLQHGPLLTRWADTGDQRYVELDGALYRRTVERHNDTHYRHSLTRVDTEAVAANVSVPVTGASAATQRVVRRGEARVPADARLPTERLLDTGGNYVMVAPVAHSHLESLPPVEIPMVAVGLLVFWRAGVRYRHAVDDDGL